MAWLGARVAVLAWLCARGLACLRMAAWLRVAAHGCLARAALALLLGCFAACCFGLPALHLQLAGVSLNPHARRPVP